MSDDLLAGQSAQCSPLSMLAWGNVRDERRAVVGTFPAGGALTGGLHYSVFTMQSRPMATLEERRNPKGVRTGPTPQQVLTHGRRF